MPVYKKRNESSLVSYVMRYLAAQEGFGRVVWFSRLQSGSVKVVKRWGTKRHEHWMHLCRKGTPDIMAVIRTGEVLWLELKTTTGVIGDAQYEFKDIVGKMDTHHHLFVLDLDTLHQFMNERWP